MPTSLPPRSRALILLALACAVAVAFWTFVHITPQPSPTADETESPLVPDPPTADPRVTFPTVFRNVKPEVQYVGDASCAGCHKKIDKTFHAHPMGRSAEFVGRATPIERYDPMARTSFAIGGHELRVEQTPTGIVHHVGARDSTGASLPDYAIAANLAIGSGTRGRSYLSIQAGAVWQSPISWFSPKGRWDLSPGFDLGTDGRRAIIPECLFCHVDRVEPVPGALNRYREPLFPIQAAIGCERCHGPGALHVAERTASGIPARVPDTSIVNPNHLPSELRSSVCAQCHLQGQERVVRRGRSLYEFRPGLPLEQFVTVFVRHPDLVDLHRSVGQFEQMESSRCFTASKSRLGCTTCHDPHESPSAATTGEYYRDRCLTCHGPGSKECSARPSERRAKVDACTLCHMPSSGSSNIAHASVTDHRILRRAILSPPPRGLAYGVPPLVPFRTGPNVPSELERERDLGIALARVVGKTPNPATRSLLGGLATDRLSVSLKMWRGDADGWIAASASYTARGDQAEASKAADAARTLAPESELALELEADTAIAVGKFDAAVNAATKQIEMNPTATDPRVTRALAFVHQRDWAKAEDDCRKALDIHPLHPRARLLLAVCRHHQGDPAGGRKEAATAAGLLTAPRDRSSFVEWYQEKTR